MKKKLFCGLVFFAGILSQGYPATGYANDGFELALFLGSFLLLVAGIIHGFDFLNKNSKMLMHRFKVYIKSKFVHL